MNTSKISGDKSYQRQLFFRRYGIVFVMIGMILLLTVVTKNFLSYNNILNVLSTISINGCIALGMCIVITAGGIDLTVGALLAWGSVVAGLVLKSTQSIPMACVAALITCAVMGLITGLMIAQFDLFPFVATLAMQLVIRGLATALSGGASFPVAVSAFTKIGLGKVFGVGADSGTDSSGTGGYCLHINALDQIWPLCLCDWRQSRRGNCFRCECILDYGMDLCDFRYFYRCGGSDYDSEDQCISAEYRYRI